MDKACLYTVGSAMLAPPVLLEPDALLVCDAETELFETNLSFQLSSRI